MLTRRELLTARHAARIAADQATGRAWALAKVGYIPPSHPLRTPALWSKRLVKTLVRPWPTIPKGALLAIAETANQKVALDGVLAICARETSVVHVGGDNEASGIGTVSGQGKKQAAARSVAALAVTGIGERSADTRWRASFSKALEAGHYIQGSGARYMLVSNDHSALPFHAIHMALALGVPSGYVQHAPVTELFPPLATDAAFLDGARALDVYAAVAHTTGATHRPTVFLTGIQRRITPSKGIALGVAVNRLDQPTPLIKEAIGLLGAETSIVLRPHPAMPQDALEAWQAFAAACGATMSQPGIESSTAFVQRIHTLLAGNTGLHLEAALAGVSCHQWPAEDGIPNDYYGFQALGLVQAWEQKASRRTPTVDQLRHWSHTYATPWAGYEAHLVAALVMNKVRTGSYQPESVGMRRVPRQDGWCVWEPDPAHDPAALFPNAFA
jgi:hypothetical protein